MDSNTQNNYKRSRNQLDSESSDDEHSPNMTQVFPRFLIVESTDETRKMSSLSPFVIEKQIESLAGIPKSVKKLKSGNLLIEVEKPQHARNLLKISEFFHIPCKCFPHTSLNTSRGVIRCPDLAGVSDQEIATELKSQHVTAAKRIQIKRDGKTLDTNTIILTFGTSILPRTLQVGYLVTKVEVYIPNPLQCFSCFKFGHGSKVCRAEDVCPKCAGNAHQHNEEDCTYPLKCINCGEQHSARSKQCKQWKLEKEVLQVKYSQNIAFPEARKIVNSRHAAPTTSYASITKSGNKSVELKDAQTQTPTVDSTITTTQKTPEQGNNTKTQQTLVTKPVPNIVNYKNTSKSNNPRTQKPSQSRRGVNETPRQKIQLTDRTKKGSENPISNFNRFDSLSDREEMEDDGDFVPDVPPPSVTRGGRIRRLSPPR